MSPIPNLPKIPKKSPQTGKLPASAFFAPCVVYNHAPKKAALTESKKGRTVWPNASSGPIHLDCSMAGSPRGRSPRVCAYVCVRKTGSHLFYFTFLSEKIHRGLRWKRWKRNGRLNQFRPPGRRPWPAEGTQSLGQGWGQALYGLARKDGAESARDVLPRSLPGHAAR